MIISQLAYNAALAIVASVELFHALAHLNVVFFFFKKPIARRQFLYANGWYFYLDWLTVVGSTLLVSQFFTRKLHSSFYLLVISQILQHLYFCIPWASRPTHVRAVVEWSCKKPVKRAEQVVNDWYHWLGTMFDASIHTLMFFMDVLTIASTGAGGASLESRVVFISASILCSVMAFVHYCSTQRS